MTEGLMILADHEASSSSVSAILGDDSVRDEVALVAKDSPSILLPVESSSGDNLPEIEPTTTRNVLAIQSTWDERYLRRSEAAMILQRVSRRYMAEKQIFRHRQLLVRSTVSVQSAWRRRAARIAFHKRREDLCKRQEDDDMSGIAVMKLSSEQLASHRIATDNIDRDQTATSNNAHQTTAFHSTGIDSLDVDHAFDGRRPAGRITAHRVVVTAVMLILLVPVALYYQSSISERTKVVPMVNVPKRRNKWSVLSRFKFPTRKRKGKILGSRIIDAALADNGITKRNQTKAPKTLQAISKRWESLAILRTESTIIPGTNSGNQSNPTTLRDVLSFSMKNYSESANQRKAPKAAKRLPESSVTKVAKKLDPVITKAKLEPSLANPGSKEKIPSSTAPGVQEAPQRINTRKEAVSKLKPKLESLESFANDDFIKLVGKAAQEKSTLDNGSLRKALNSVRDPDIPPEPSLYVEVDAGSSSFRTIRSVLDATNGNRIDTADIVVPTDDCEPNRISQVLRKQSLSENAVAVEIERLQTESRLGSTARRMAHIDLTGAWMADDTTPQSRERTVSQLLTGQDDSWREYLDGTPNIVRPEVTSIKDVLLEDFLPLEIGSATATPTTLKDALRLSVTSVS